MKIQINRESVCLGDDINDHSKNISVDINATYEELLFILKEMCYFPNVSGNNVVWVLTTNGFDCIFSYFTLTNKLSFGISQRMLLNICKKSDSCSFFLKYYSSPQKWKDAIYKMYNNDGYTMWRDGWTQEIEYCDYLTSLNTQKSEVYNKKTIMKVLEVKERTPLLIQQLLEIWENSVRTTHLFLSDSEIENIKKYVPQALSAIPHLIVAENEKELPIAFMGIEGQKLEMLFVLSEERGNGLGKSLVRYGIETYSINEVAVNEQNPLAKAFYERMGFIVYKRTDNDEQGNPYPLLYMNRSKKEL